MTILLYISVILLKAVSDGLNDSGQKGIGHTADAFDFGLLLTMPYLVQLPQWHIQVISFTLLMIALFDLTYNKTRGLKWSYVGTTSWWDQAIAKVPFGFMLFVRGLCFLVGVSLLMGWHNKVIKFIQNM